MLAACAWAIAWTMLPSLMLNTAIEVATSATTMATTLLRFELDSWARATASWICSSVSPMARVYSDRRTRSSKTGPVRQGDLARPCPSI